MEEYENYYFIPYQGAVSQNYNLIRIAEKAGYDSIHRTKIRLKIQELIKALQS